MKNDPRSCDRNFYNCVKKPEKNSGLQRGLNHASFINSSFARSRVQAPLKSWIFFRLLYAIVKIAITTARIILHLISYPQFTYDLFHMHHSFTYLSREHMNPQLTCSQRQWLHSSVGRVARSRVQAPLKSWIFFRLLYAIVKIAITTARIILHLKTLFHCIAKVSKLSTL